MTDGTIAAPSAARRQRSALAGIAFVLAAMIAFSAMDAVSKLLAEAYHPVMIAGARYGFLLLWLAPVFYLARRKLFASTRPGLQVVRGVAMLGSALFFIAATQRLPLADATAMSFISPCLVTALSIPLLGERVGPRRWIAVAIGFLGVLVVVRPGPGFDPAAILPLLSALCWALGLVSTRMMPQTDSAATTLAFVTVVGLLGLAPVLPFFWEPPDLSGLALMALMAALYAVGQGLLIGAYAAAPASVLSPFLYSQMIWSTVFGGLVFGDFPDPVTLAGAAIIVGSGLYTLARERRRGD